MEYDNTNRGALFRNDDKDPNDDKERDYTGTLDVGGTEHWISGWVRTSRKTGKKYLSLQNEGREAGRAREEIARGRPQRCSTFLRARGAPQRGRRVVSLWALLPVASEGRPRSL